VEGRAVVLVEVSAAAWVEALAGEVVEASEVAAVQVEA
jgi:hypothetical protein